MMVKKHYQEFKNIKGLVEYLSKGTTTHAFAEEYGVDLYSMKTSPSTVKFSGSESFDEALELLQNGWGKKAEEIEAKFKLASNSSLSKLQKKFIADVAGFQPIVANYLMGIPNSMVGSKVVARKQRVATLNAQLPFSAKYTTEQIMDYCINNLLVVSAIEKQGVRVNLNILFACWNNFYSKEYGLMKVRLKNANERLNVSKVAFPLSHPSYLRRICFRYEEVTDFYQSAASGYGKPINDSLVASIFKEELKGEYLIPSMVEKADGDIFSKLIEC